MVNAVKTRKTYHNRSKIVYNYYVRKVLLYISAILLCIGCSQGDYDQEITSPYNQPSGNTLDSLTLRKIFQKLTPTNSDRKTYPDAGIPRLSIVTETQEDPKDEYTNIPAFAIIIENGKVVSDTMKLSLHVRGNTTSAMPKRSFKIDFTDKVNLLGMPENRDWALLANYGDKTLLKNFIAFKLSEWLGASYTPRSRFVELFLNGSYRGLYQLTETIEVAKNRVNIPEQQWSYLVEIDRKFRDDEEIVINEHEITFRIHSPKNPTEESKKQLQLHLDSLDRYLEYIHQDYTLALDSAPDNWFDIKDFVRHYWIQEFTKNTDAIPYTSVFFTWVAGSVIRMGPIWDFDMAFGVPAAQEDPTEWYIRNYSWYHRLAMTPNVSDSIATYWENHREIFEALPDSIDVFAAQISAAVENNYKFWNDILGNVNDDTYTKAYNSHAEAVEDLKSWITKRTRWINENLRN